MTSCCHRINNFYPKKNAPKVINIAAYMLICVCDPINVLWIILWWLSKVVTRTYTHIVIEIGACWAYVTVNLTMLIKHLTAIICLTYYHPSTKNNLSASL